MTLRMRTKRAKADIVEYLEEKEREKYKKNGKLLHLNISER